MQAITILHASTQGNSLYLNLAKGKFEEVAQRYGVHEAGWAWGSSAFDYDRDGDLDFYITSDVGHANFLYRNEGNRVFVNVM